MNIHLIYFSPTGGTKKVVQLLSRAWAGEAREIDCSVPGHDYSAYSFSATDLCIVGVPAFGGRVPAVALEHLTQMRAAGTPTVIAAAFGNRDYDDTLLELRDGLRQSGFHVFAAVAAVTEHSIMRQFGAGRPDASDEKELIGYGEAIRRTLEQGGALTEVAVKGNTPYKAYGGLPLKPKADRACTRCGACAAVCPVGAIPSQSPSETRKDLCISCMRCILVCPRQARKLNPALLFAAAQKMNSGCSESKKNELYVGESK